jgi:hypothetical protein
MGYVESEKWDVVVYGGTPGGIMAAIAAARRGCRTLLVDRYAHVGGMSTSGLGKSDIENRAAIGGLFREFVRRVYDDYVLHYGEGSEQVRQCREGFYYEPSVAERVFERMLADEPNIECRRGQQLISAETRGDRLVAFCTSGSASLPPNRIEADVFIDASYEGDLAAAAGAAFRIGREGRDEFNEPHAGVIYRHYESGEILPGSTGQGDNRLPAYTYRLCLTTDPSNAAALVEPPPDYDRSLYAGYLKDLAEERFVAPKKYRDGWGYNPAHYDTLVRVLSVTVLPNHKNDVNINPRPLGFPFPEENIGYVEGDPGARERICRRHRNLTLGLLYFLQNDQSVPAEHRAIARQYHLPKDEFVDNSHFPWQLYIREARRIKGEYILTEHDVTVPPGQRRTPVHFDSIATGEFPIDSFPVRRYEPGQDTVLEGYLSMLEDVTRPYQIPYGIMVPQRVDGLLVPVAASTTHVAFSTIRMEPCWMAMGQAAGVAAALAVEGRMLPRDISIDTLQRLLFHQGQILTFFYDLDEAGPDMPAIQFFGARGIFDDYFAWPRRPVDRATAADWLRKMFQCLDGGHWLTAAVEFRSEDVASVGARALLDRETLGHWLARVADGLRLQLDPRLTQLGDVFAAAVSDSAMRPVEANGDSIVTRGQFCTLLYRLLERLRRDKPLRVVSHPTGVPAPHRKPVHRPISATDAMDVP